MGKKTFLGNTSHEESVKLRQEVKNVIDRMVLDGITITVKEVERQAKVSHGLVYKDEIKAYIEEAKEKQKNEKQRVDIKTQNSVLYKKLMSSYIFEYALLDEHEAFLKDAIEKMKSDNTIADNSIKFLISCLEQEIDEKKIRKLMKDFNASLGEDIPDWKEKVLPLLSNGCVARSIIQNT